MSIIFQKAERKQTPIKIAITGPSGSGKTYSSLALATGLGKKIALADTENRSASLYSDKFDFDTVSIDPPFTTEKYISVIKAAEEAGYEVLIIDSLSHSWAGEGGILDRKSALDARGGNSYTNWGKLTPEHEKIKSAILFSQMHVIACMRSKQDYIMVQNEKGKQAPQKVGLAPVQREGIEYEFWTVFDIGMDHSFTVSKDRTGLFDGRCEKMSASHGKEFKQYLESAPSVLTLSQKQELKALMEKLEWSVDEMKQFISDQGYNSSSDILQQDFDKIQKELMALFEKRGTEAKTPAAKEEKKPVNVTSGNPITSKQRSFLWSKMNGIGWDEPMMESFLEDHGFKGKFSDVSIPMSAMDELLAALEKEASELLQEEEEDHIPQQQLETKGEEIDL